MSERQLELGLFMCILYFGMCFLARPLARSRTLTHVLSSFPARAPLAPPAAVSLSRCSRCRSVWYCGPAHQRSHWPQHKPDCAALAAAAAAAAAGATTAAPVTTVTAVTPAAATTTPAPSAVEAQPKPEPQTKAEKKAEEEDDDIELLVEDTVKVPLACPVSCVRITTPVRSKRPASLPLSSASPLLLFLAPTRLPALGLAFASPELLLLGCSLTPVSLRFASSARRPCVQAPRLFRHQHVHQHVHP